jgi:hypothetical protein
MAGRAFSSSDDRNDGDGVDDALSFTDPLPLVDVFHVVDARFQARVALQKLLRSGGGGRRTYDDEKDDDAEDEQEGADGDGGQLEARATQFLLVQKKLLSRYRDRMPGPTLRGLDALLEESFHGILDTATVAEQQQKVLRRETENLRSAMQLLSLLVALRAPLRRREYEQLRTAFSVDVDDYELRGAHHHDNDDEATLNCGTTAWEERAYDAISALHQEWFGGGATAIRATPPPPFTSTDALKQRIKKLCEKTIRRGHNTKRESKS